MAGEFYIRLQTGIAGGFAPPNPTSVHQITSSLDGNGAPSILLQTTTRGPGQRRLPDEPTAQSTFKHDAVDHATNKKVGTRVEELVSQLEAILKKLPVESPPGSMDIYGMDIGLTFMKESLQWSNSAPQGCGGVNSDVQATDAEREEFKKALGIVDELVKLGQVDTTSA